MSALENGKIGLVAAREWGRLGVDALADVAGLALPYKPDVVLRPQVLAGLLNDYGTNQLPGPVSLGTVQARDVPSISSNCQTLVVDVEHDGSGLPDSLFVKLPMQSLMTRWFLSVISSWRLETHFFRHVASSVPLRTPLTYAAHARGTRFFLVQENLRDDPSVELFTNPDMMVGPSLELARRCLDGFARLHAAHYDLPRAEQQALLPLDYHPFLSPQMGALSKVLNRVALKPCMKKLPGVIPAEVERAYLDTIDNWDALLDYWFAGPLSLLHGDSHLGNFFVSGDAMGMLDWQAAHWGRGIRDVQYFLILSLPRELLARHERELVQYYVERRAVHGTAIDAQQTWQDYRGFSYHALMTMVVSVGLGALNEEQDAVMAELLGRAVAAVWRLDYAGWLQEFLDGHPR